MKETTKQIDDILGWLTANKTSENIVAISQVLDRLSILMVTIGNDAMEAYGLMVELEDAYDKMYAAEFVIVMKEKSAAAAKPIVGDKLSENKRDFSRAKVLYKKLSTYLDRLDKVLECHRSYLSALKQDRKIQ